MKYKCSNCGCEFDTQVKNCPKCNCNLKYPNEMDEVIMVAQAKEKNDFVAITCALAFSVFSFFLLLTSLAFAVAGKNDPSKGVIIIVFFIATFILALLGSMFSVKILSSKKTIGIIGIILSSLSICVSFFFIMIGAFSL